MHRPIAGVDGCKGGWLAILELNGELSALVAPNLETLIDKLPEGLIGIDIPIGLPMTGSRGCDLRARQLLGRPRGNSVFPAPIRACLQDRDYDSLCSLHRAIDGRGLTRQAFCLLPKIKQVDDFLARVPTSAETLREVHPEVSFAFWNERRPMRFRKTTREGRRERQFLIDREWPGERERLIRELRGSRFAKDDLNDAFAALWSARRIAAGLAELLPEEVERDPTGLQMRIEV